MDVFYVFNAARKYHCHEFVTWFFIGNLQMTNTETVTVWNFSAQNFQQKSVK